MMEDFHKIVEQTIAQHGWLTLGVGVADDALGRPYTITIGFTGKEWPELLVLGREDHLARDLFEHVRQHIEHRGVPLDRTAMRAPSGEGFVVRDIESEFASRTHFVQASQFYGRAVQAKQLVLPDRHGRYPWEPGCDWQWSALQCDIVDWTREICH